jgi:hypothetical protein
MSTTAEAGGGVVPSRSLVGVLGLAEHGIAVTGAIPHGIDRPMAMVAPSAAEQARKEVR